MTREKIEHPGDPRQCQAVTRNGGQCEYKSTSPETQYCEAHGGMAQEAAVERENLRNYRLTRWKTRIAEMGDNPNIKSLRDEIGILRILLEERLNICQDATDLILNSQPIADLVMRVERVVTSCHKLEGSMKQLVDKTALLSFASQIIDVISTEITNDEVLDRISTGIISLINTQGDSND